MAVEARIRELGSRHQILDRAIEEEGRAPAVDSLRIKDMKRQRLRLKEQIEVLRGARAH